MDEVDQVFRSQILYRVIYIQYIYHRAKFDFSSLSSLANTEGDLKPLSLFRYYIGQNSPG